MSRRISVNKELSPAGTNITATVNSNVAVTKAAADARVFIPVTTRPGAETMDAEIQVAPENVDAQFVTVKTIAITTAQNYFESLKEEELSAYLRVRFIPSAGGTWILGATLNKKQEA